MDDFFDLSGTGWEFRIYRQPDGGAEPPGMDSPRGEWIASWEAPVLGLRWIEDLIQKGKAIKVGSNCGYPNRYAAIAEHVLLSLLELPPKDGPRWTGGEVVWSRTSAVDQCRLEEWLIVDVWDQS